MQIAYKMHLGSEKDFEDAKHLFEVFKETPNEVWSEQHARFINSGFIIANNGLYKDIRKYYSMK